MMVLLLLAALPVAWRRQRDVAEFKGHSQRVRLGQLQTAPRVAHPRYAASQGERREERGTELLLTHSGNADHRKVPFRRVEQCVGRHLTCPITENLRSMRLVFPWRSF